jgi:hypothetical protein
MSVKSQITTKAQEIFNIRIRRNSSLWPKISSLSQVYGEDAVVGAFEAWSTTKVGELVLADNFEDFIQDAYKLFNHQVVLKPSLSANEAVAEITLISKGTVVLNKKQSLIITRWLRNYTKDEIIAGFCTFYGPLGQGYPRFKFIARDFCKKGLELLELARFHRKQEKVMEHQRQEQIMRKPFLAPKS